MLAVSQNGCMLEHAAAALRKDHQVVLNALRSAGRVLHYAAIELKASVELLLPLLECHGAVLRAVPLLAPELRSVARLNLRRTLLEGAVELKEHPEILKAMAEQSSLEPQPRRSLHPRRHAKRHTRRISTCRCGAGGEG